MAQLNEESVKKKLEELLMSDELLNSVMGSLSEKYAYEAKYGDMFIKLKPQIEKGKKHPLFYRGFEGCMNGAGDPYKQYQVVTGLLSEPGPEWGAFMEGWEMCCVLRDGTDRDGVPLTKQEVAIIFDLSKMSYEQVWGIRKWRMAPLNDEKWEEASWHIEEFHPGGAKGDNYWFVCRNKRWTGNLLKFLIEQKYPDDSYRVIPNPNL